MNKPNQHINDLLRQRFENFEPTPPEHIWENIEKNLDSKPGFFSGNRKYFTSVLILLTLIPVIYFSFNTNYIPLFSTNINNLEINSANILADGSVITKNEQIVEQNTNIKNTKSNTVPFEKKIINPEEISNTNETIDNKNTELSISDNSNFNEEQDDIANSTQQNENIETLNIFELKESFLKPKNSLTIQPLNNLNLSSICSNNYGQTNSKNINDIFKGVVSKEKNNGNGHWENTIFISPEFSLTNLDSVTILNSYSIGVEPSRYFNENVFLRFGLNLSFSGDKGFAKIDYRSNEFMGTYDDVYNVTFDTMGGNVTPIYHTKTVEIWDSIQQIGVSGVTNNYLFAQIPVLLGYKNKIGQLNWYVYGGPALGFQIGKWLEEASIEGKDIEIIDLDNKLPIRSTVNYQLWLGGGIEYKLNYKSSIVIEPSYRYYFKSLYSDSDYKFNTSSFALRIGFNYKIGN